MCTKGILAAKYGILFKSHEAIKCRELQEEIESLRKECEQLRDRIKELEDRRNER